MKKFIVIFFLLLFAAADWQRQEEIKLPEGIQVNDLGVDSSGELFILTSSGLFKLNLDSKEFVLIRELKNHKLLSPTEDANYLIDFANRIMIFQQLTGDIHLLPISFGDVQQLSVVKLEKKNIIVASETNRLLFTDGNEIIGTINLPSERFCIPQIVDRIDSEIPIFTLSNNQIYRWYGGNPENPLNYRNQILYSSSGKIIDFTVAPTGKLYILFADSIVTIDDKGKYIAKESIENIPSGSRILANPAKNSILVYNPRENVVEIFSLLKKEKTEILTLQKNRPNPVDNYTEIEFALSEPLDLTLTIYNLIGEPVKVIARGRFNEGTHIIPWHADDEQGNLVPCGVYFYRLETKKGVLIKQLVVLR